MEEKEIEQRIDDIVNEIPLESIPQESKDLLEEKFLEKIPKTVLILFALFLFIFIGLCCIKLSLLWGDNTIVIYIASIFFIWLIILPIKILLYALRRGKRPVTHIIGNTENLSLYMQNNEAKTILENKNLVMRFESYSKTQFISKYYIKCIDKKTKHFFTIIGEESIIASIWFFLNYDFKETYTYSGMKNWSEELSSSRYSHVLINHC